MNEESREVEARRLSQKRRQIQHLEKSLSLPIKLFRGFKIGDRVNWIDCPDELEEYAPFVVISIDKNKNTALLNRVPVEVSLVSLRSIDADDDADDDDVQF